MADRKLTLAVDFVGNDKVSSTVVAMGRVSAEATQRIGGLKRQVDTLNRSLSDARALRTATDALKRQRTATKEAAAELARLKSQIVAGTPPTAQLVRSIQAAEKNLTKMQVAEKKASDTARTMVSNFRAAGVDVARLGKFESETASRIENANRALEHQRTVLGENRRRMGEMTREERARDRASGGRIGRDRHDGRVRPASSPVDEEAPGAERSRLDPAKIHSAGLKAVSILGQAASVAEDAADVGASFEALKFRLRQLGLSVDAVNQLVAATDAMQVDGASRTDKLRIAAEAQAVFRETGKVGVEHQLEGAKLVTPLLARIFVTQKAVGQEFTPEQEKYLLRVVEQQGGLASPQRAADIIGGLFKALTSSNGIVSPENYQTFLSAAKTSGNQLSARSLFSDFEPIIAEMGERAGTGLSGAYSNLNGINKSQQRMHELIRLGMWDRSKIIFNKVDGVKAFKNGENPLRAELAKQLAEDPVDFYFKSVRPRYVKGGVKDFNRENLMVFGGTGGALFNQFEKMGQKFFDDARKTYDGTMGLGEAHSMVVDGMLGSKERLHAATEDFNLSLATAGGVVDGFTSTMSWAAGIIKGMADKAAGLPSAPASPLPQRPAIWRPTDLANLGGIAGRPGIGLTPQLTPPAPTVAGMPAPRVTLALPTAAPKGRPAPGKPADWTGVNLSRMGGPAATPAMREAAKPMTPVAINLRLPPASPPPPPPRPSGPVTININGVGQTVDQLATAVARKLEQKQGQQQRSSYNGGR